MKYKRKNGVYLKNFKYFFEKKGMFVYNKIIF